MWYTAHATPAGPAYEKIYVEKLRRNGELVKGAPRASGAPTRPGLVHGPQARPAAELAQTKTQIALIDMNSYFATLEQQTNPFLRGKPLGIVKDRGRSCVIAASKEAKVRGIKTGCSVWDARKLAPGFLTVPADFDKYFYNTQVLKRIFESLSPTVDVFSLDEAFLDLTECARLYPTPAAFFARAQHEVKTLLGPWVTFSLGFGANRLQAKLASEFAGPDNWFEISPTNVDSCLSECKVEDICGIGYALTAKLHRLNIEHPYQLNFCDDAFLRQHFGVFWGPELRRIGRGENSHTLSQIDHPLEHMKSVGRSKTLYKASADRDYLRQLTANLAEDMCFKARRMQLAGQEVSLGLRDTDGHWFGGRTRMTSYVRHTDEVFNVLAQILANVEKQFTAPIIKVSVRLGGLRPLQEIPQSWLPAWNQREKVFAAVDKVNEKHGLYTVKSARLANFKILMPEVTGFLGDKIYQFGGAAG